MFIRQTMANALRSIPAPNIQKCSAALSARHSTESTPKSCWRSFPITATQRRATELEKLICKIYEDNILGKLPDARYAALDEQYSKEQGALSEEMREVEAAISGYEKSRKSADKFIALIEKYENFDTLTTPKLLEFVEKNLVYERDRKGSTETTQRGTIYILTSLAGTFPYISAKSTSRRKNRKNYAKKGAQGQASPKLFEA